MRCAGPTPRWRPRGPMAYCPEIRPAQPAPQWPCIQTSLSKLGSIKLVVVNADRELLGALALDDASLMAYKSRPCGVEDDNGPSV